MHGSTATLFIISGRNFDMTLTERRITLLHRVYAKTEFESVKGLCLALAAVVARADWRAPRYAVARRVALLEARDAGRQHN